ncbi:MAG TPA: polysaccharide biosynthesis tyrosine autokinase [Acidimicrobiales bacterium]|nr:polysaccharide biosynthesis tyrosine autokinase [Acidimicrobiales bacterium]
MQGDLTEGEQLDLRDYLSIIGRRWRWLVGSILLFLVPTLALSLTAEPVYRAYAEVLIDTAPVDSVFSERPAGGVDSERSLNNEMRVIRSSGVVGTVRRDYDGPIEIRNSTLSVDAAGPRSDVVHIEAKGPDAADAADLANLYAETYLNVSRTQRVDRLLFLSGEIQERIDSINESLENSYELVEPLDEQLAADPTNAGLIATREAVLQQIEDQTNILRNQRDFYSGQLETLRFSAGLSESGGARLLSPALPPRRPVSPQPVKNSVLALLLGSVLGVGAAFVRDRLDDTIRTAEDIARVTGGEPATIGLIPGLDNVGGLAVQDDPRGIAAEAYRSLRPAVRFAGLDRKLRVLQLTSSNLGEGKTTTVANLAVVMAQAGQKVAIVCCDLRRPRVHEMFGQSLSPGFTDILLGEATLSQALRHLGQNLYLLPAGGRPPNPSELLQTTRAESMISALAAEFDYVLIDSTPILPVTDGLVVSHSADATLVVVDAKATTRDQLRQTLNLLRQADAPLIGFVLNRVSGGGGGGEAYTYAYAVEDEQEGRGRRFRMPLPKPKVHADA